MSCFNKDPVCSIVQNLINTYDFTANTNPDTNTDPAFLAASLNKFTQKRCSIQTFDDLPDLSTTNIPNGHIVYLCDAKTLVMSSNNSWIGLDGRTIGTALEKQLFMWGFTTCGLLNYCCVALVGANICSPVRDFESATNWCQVSTGNYSSAGIKNDNTLWTWGSYECGLAGNGVANGSQATPSPTLCKTSDWVCVKVNSLCRNMISLKSTGQIWSWGLNTCGHLGDGTTVTRCSPVQERCSATDWCRIAIGSSTLAIKTDGSLWGWGLNTSGAIGDGTITSRCSPVREICSATNWVEVDHTGIEASIALKTDGSVWTWGCNSSGELGDGTTVNKCSPVREGCSATNWCKVASGWAGKAAIKTDGSLWLWGNNNCGCLGDGTTVNKCSPIREFCSATNWCHVVLGAYHSLAIKTDGSLWSWSRNNRGQLADGTVIPKCSPVREISSSNNWFDVTSLNRCGVMALKNVVIVSR